MRLNRTVALLIVLTALVIAGGCGKSSKQPNNSAKPEIDAKKKKEDDENRLPPSVVAGPGEATQFGNTGDQRVTQWSVKWDEAVVALEDRSASGGRMSGVSGVLHTKGVPSSNFRADQGRADKAKEVLELRGGVRIISRKPESVLTCDQVVYEAKEQRIRAVGNVRVSSNVGTFGPVAELWASPDLDLVSTPDLFNRP